MAEPKTRSELVSLIAQRKREIQTAGTIHKRDLTKNLHRLQKQLQEYDRLHKGVSDDG